MKVLHLLNPPRHMKIRRRRRIGRVRRVRRNPPKKTTSAAIRRKISLAVKAANRRRAAGRSSPRRAIARRRRTTIIRVPSRRRRFPVVRAIRRRAIRRYGGGGRMTFKNILSRENLTIGAGVVGSAVLSQFVMVTFGRNLPMATSPIAGLVYRAAIPILGGMALQRTNRNLAKGLMIGGVALAITDALRMWFPVALNPAGAIAPTAGTSEYLNSYKALPAMNAGYDATSAFGRNGGSVYDSESAFPASAWD